MLKVQNLMLPVDFSEASIHAAEWAIGFAGELGVETIHLVHVAVLQPSNDIYANVVDLTNAQEHFNWLSEESKSKWTTLKTRIETEGYACEEGLLQADSIAPALIQYAQQNEIDLIALSTYGRAGLALKILGSVADLLIEKAPCPVLSVRYDLPTDSYRDVKKILVPLDFSNHSADALRVAREWAKQTKARLTALNVIERNEKIAPPASDWEKHYNEQNPSPRQMPKLEAFLGETEGPKVRTHPALMYGDPVDATLTYLSVYSHDLIIMATRGQRREGLFGFGNAAEALVRQAPCPVLTIKDSDRVTIVKPKKTKKQVTV